MQFIIILLCHIEFNFISFFFISFINDEGLGVGLELGGFRMSLLIFNRICMC